MSSARPTITPARSKKLAAKTCETLGEFDDLEIQDSLSDEIADAISANFGFIRLPRPESLKEGKKPLLDDVLFIDYSMESLEVRLHTPVQLKLGAILRSWEGVSKEFAEQLVPTVVHQNFFLELLRPGDQGRCHVFDWLHRASVFHLTGASVDICFYLRYHTPGATDSQVDIYLIGITADERGLGLTKLSAGILAKAQKNSAAAYQAFLEENAAAA